MKNEDEVIDGGVVGSKCSCQLRPFNHKVKNFVKAFDITEEMSDYAYKAHADAYNKDEVNSTSELVERIWNDGKLDLNAKLFTLTMCILGIGESMGKRHMMKRMMGEKEERDEK